MKFFFLLLPLLLMFIVPYTQLPGKRINLPLGGNSFVTVKAAGGQEEVTNGGWKNWEKNNTVWSVYVQVNTVGTLNVVAPIAVPVGESKIQFSIDNKSISITARGADSKEYAVGQWKITKPGYVKIDVRGISKTGELFANINELVLQGSAVDDKTIYVKNNDDNYFYWGRRGPSVHINYDLSEVGNDIEWFYNEVTVPAGSDVTGSYFMANGFGEGYFGMQVNSPAERRILFSVWSPFNTDNPKEIPDDKKIVLLKKGKGVHTGEFGNEGSGGQSYLKYNWKAGEACRFLLKATPAENNFTSYTAWFYDNENKEWLLIASFNRPATSTYLKRLHSFLENFSPNTGYIKRKAFYHNQWVRTKAGEWKPIHKMFLTADATAGKKKFRMDYGGGVQNGKFYMENGGFFNESAILQKQYEVSTTATAPTIDWEGLK